MNPTPILITTTTFALSVVAFPCALPAEEPPSTPPATTIRTITEFDSEENPRLDWRIVDDGVMGGLSKGRATRTDEGTLRFEGTLSLENNGGFTSVRTGEVAFDLDDCSAIALRVKGDGRTYQVRFATDARFRGMEISFKADFPTTAGEWTEVMIPFSKFTGSWRGRELPEEVFDPARIERIGLLIGDKKPGPFALEVDWIRGVATAEKGAKDSPSPAP